MGYMQKWDLTDLIKKLELVAIKEQKVSYKADIMTEDASILAS